MNQLQPPKYISTHFNTPNEQYWTETVVGFAENPHKLVIAAGLVVAVATPIVLAVSALALSIFALVTVNPFLLTGATCAVFLIAASTPAALLSTLIRLKEPGLKECLKSCNYVQFFFERNMKAKGLDKRREEFEKKMKPIIEPFFEQIERRATRCNASCLKQEYHLRMRWAYKSEYGNSEDPELQERLKHYLEERIDRLVNACTAA